MHPRLFFSSDQVPVVQEQATSTHAGFWAPIVASAEASVGSAPPASAPPDGSLNEYRGYGNRLISFAFACVIGGEPGHCELAKTYLLTYATWDQWGENNARDLGHAHMLLGNALAYDWLYDRLSDAERVTVRESLGNWAHKMYEASVQNYQGLEWRNWWKRSYMQNHHWINHSALGMAGLALLGEDDRAQNWIDQAAENMERVQYMLNGIGDGSWHEGIPYQSYGLTMSLPFLINLRRIQGTDLLPHTYLRNYPYWRIYNHIPNSTQFILAYGNFDWSWSNGYDPQNILHFTAAEYQDGYAEWMAQQLIAADEQTGNGRSATWSVFEFLYYDPGVGARSPDDLPKERVFPDLEGVIWRTGWGEEDLIFGLKTGSYAGRFAYETFTQEVYPWEPRCDYKTGCGVNIGHDHDDTNGFYLYGGGRWLAPESEGYDRVTTSLHNTLLIDGKGQHRPPDGIEHAEEMIGTDGFLETAYSTPGFAFLVADASRRYPDTDLQEFKRWVLFVKPDYFIIVDDIRAASPHTYEWVIHFGSSVSIDGDWVKSSADEGQILGVKQIAPETPRMEDGDDGFPHVKYQTESPSSTTRLVITLWMTR